MAAAAAARSAAADAADTMPAHPAYPAPVPVDDLAAAGVAAVPAPQGARLLRPGVFSAAPASASGGDAVPASRAAALMSRGAGSEGGGSHLSRRGIAAGKGPGSGAGFSATAAFESLMAEIADITR